MAQREPVVADDTPEEVADAIEQERELGEGAAVLTTDLASGENDADEDEDEDEEQATGSLKATYTTDDKTGLTTIIVEGRYETSVQTVTDPTTGEITYTSPDFKAPQKNLKAALEWIGRNVGTRTLRAEYDRHMAPLDGANGDDAKTRKLRAQVAAAEARALQMEKIALQAQESSQQTQMALEAIMKRLGMDAAPPSSEESGAQDEPTDSESSDADQTESSGGTQKRTSRGRGSRP